MHRKRRLEAGYANDDDEDYVPCKAVKYSLSDTQPDFPTKKVHTLDSDEEDETDDMYSAACLKDEDIDGQEEKTVEHEGDTKITPFNMKEELEEGHFDGDGFYHFKKEASDIKDAWLDDIDWIKVKRADEEKNKYGSDEDDDDNSNIDDENSSIHASSNDELSTYKSILQFLHPGETVAKAIKRLGGGKKLSSAQKLKLRKQMKESGESGAESDDMQKMLRLTELANNIIIEGNMDVYEETYEMINIKLRPAKVSSPSLDMFSEQPSTSAAEGSDVQKVDEKATFDEVKWHLKWENKDDAEIHGPFSSEKMLKWQETGYFERGAYVKKTSSNDNVWYQVNRIDFELYV